MTREKLMQWIEFYGNASAFAAIALCPPRDSRAADSFAESAAMALDKIRAAIEAGTGDAR